MTNKTEDRFYFGKPGQPERFAKQQVVDSWTAGNWKVTAELYENYGLWAGRISAVNSEGSIEHLDHTNSYKNSENAKKALAPKIAYMRASAMWKPRAKSNASRPGQPERFGLEDACWEGYEPVGTKQKDGRTVPNCVPKDKNEQPEEFGVQDPAKELVRVRIGSSTVSAQEFREYAKRFVPGVSQNDFLPDMIEKVNAALQRRGDSIRAEIVTKGQGFSRPGSPDKFDASSLDRGNFAEASKSPMLGKLLSEKAMPEGGWRAVQVGSDTLVISFEDADLARDFGRRASTKGYSATSPVATTGRYWNVEVKNGK